MTTRKFGQSKLVYNRKTRTIEKITPLGKEDSGLRLTENGEFEAGTPMTNPKVSEKEMLEHLHDFMDCVHPFRKGGYCPECQAIRAAIEHRPKVSRGQIIQIIKGMPIYKTDHQVNYLCDRLRETGVEVEEVPEKGKGGCP